MTRKPYYSHTDEIPGIVNRVLNAWAAPYDEGTPPKPGDLYKITGAPPGGGPGYLRMSQENNPERLASDIQRTPAFFLGGLFHDYIHLIGPPMARVRELIDPKRHKSFDSTLAFCPTASREERIKGAYQWNVNKHYPVNSKEAVDPQLQADITSFTNTLWQNKFCDARGRLRPTGQFKGFNFITYSIGGRLAFMVENALRNKLRETLRARNEGAMSPAKLAEETNHIQTYFDKCKIIAIGHAVDWEGAPDKTPTIPKTFLIGKDDEGVMYPKSFWDFMQAQDCGGAPAVEVDISKQFHAKPGSHRVFILDDGVMADVMNSRSTANLHGLPDYVRALQKHREHAAVKGFLDELNNCVGRTIPGREQNGDRPQTSQRSVG